MWEILNCYIVHPLKKSHLIMFYCNLQKNPGANPPEPPQTPLRLRVLRSPPCSPANNAAAAVPGRRHRLVSPTVLSVLRPSACLSASSPVCLPAGISALTRASPTTSTSSSSFRSTISITWPPLGCTTSPETHPQHKWCVELPVNYSSNL